MPMIFIETPMFTRRAQELLDDLTYANLQLALVRDPCKGMLIEGTGGIRKVRIAANGQGQRGGARVIYYHFVSESNIAFLLVYAKNEQANLTAEQKKALKSVIENWR